MEKKAPLKGAKHNRSLVGSNKAQKKKSFALYRIQKISTELPSFLKDGACEPRTICI